MTISSIQNTPKKNKSSTPPNCTTCFWCCSNRVKDKTNNINKIIWQLMWMMTFFLTWVVPCFFHIHTHKFHLFPSKSLFGPTKSMVAGFTYSMVVAVEWDIDINQYHHGSGPQTKNLSWKVMVTETRGEIKCGTRIAAGQVELWFFLPKKNETLQKFGLPFRNFVLNSLLSSTKTCQCWRSSRFSHGIESCKSLMACIPCFDKSCVPLFPWRIHGTNSFFIPVHEWLAIFMGFHVGSIYHTWTLWV